MVNTFREWYQQGLANAEDYRYLAEAATVCTTGKNIYPVPPQLHTGQHRAGGCGAGGFGY